ncbi:MAG: 3'-5' exonuclease, partial [Pseudolabrys sp.]
LFEAIIRALKNARIPVAGADRLVLMEHIAVMDLLVLADALLLPQDDLALATALKSPLFGFDDDDIFALAWNRGTQSLRAALEQKSDGNAKFAKALARLNELADRARGASPFAFYAHILGAEHGRKRFLTRLGHEAADPLDEFLNLALDYERDETPSLQGFADWLRAAKSEIKRDMEMARNEVRVMTVHGAKGLEAPIVFLADTTTRPEGHHPPPLLPLPAQSGAAPLIWVKGEQEDVGPMNDARQAARAEKRNEHRRLLYVAMTRAIERLVVCGIDSGRKRPAGCWYDLIVDALRGLCVSEQVEGGGEVWRYRKQNAAPVELQNNALPDRIKPSSLPNWLRSNAPSGASEARLLTPSSAEDDDTRAPLSGGRTNALLRGSLVHRLMQSLPEIPADKRRKAASDYLTRAAAKLTAEECAKLAEQMMLIIEHPCFHELYGPGSRAEVPIVGRLQSQRKTVRVSGQIDRLAVTQDSVLIADYKTGQRIDPAPPGYTEQLALYRAVLQKLYPNKSVRAALLWTEVPDLMELSTDVLDAALTRVTSA